MEILFLKAVALGLLDITYLFPALVVLFLTGWLFASFGLLLASYAKNYDWFIYGQSGIIIPMSLFSGTYFPLSELPSYLQPVAYSLPLTHTILAVRSLLSGQIEPSIFINIAVLFVFALMFSNLAIAKLSRRITG